LHHKAKINSLPAVSENVLLTTNERKSMSIKTNFKRLALVVVSALGFGMLSIAPSSAVAGVPTVTVTAGSASVTEGVAKETLTTATLTISGLLSATGDTYGITLFRKTAPGTPIAESKFRLAFLETSTYANTVVNSVGTAGGETAADVSLQGAFRTNADDQVVNVSYDSRVIATAGNGYYLSGTAAGYVEASFGLMLDTATTRDDGEGAYVYTAVVTPYTGGAAAVAGTPVQVDLTFTVNLTAAAAAAASGTIDPSKSTAFLGTAAGATADASISKVATAATTAHGYINVITKTSTSLQAPESVTITVTGPGLVCNPAATVCGKSMTHAADGDDDFPVRADGTAGVASIVVKTTTVTWPAKTITFYAKAAKTITATVNAPVISVGANGTALATAPIWANAVDADGNVWGGAAYVYASTAADALIAGSLATPVACTFNAAKGLHACPVSGVAKGTASFKVIDAATVALATATSNAVDLRVSTGVATTAVLSFDKATYAPGEKAQVRVQVLDEAGLAMPAITISNGFTADIATTKAFFSGNLDGSATITIDAATSSSSATNAGHDTWVVYMPMSNGEVKISATGSTGLGLAGRVALSATATVTNNDPAVAAATAAAEAAADAAAEAIDAANAATDAANLSAEAADAATVAAEEARDAADAATAAVEALATEVATLMAALKAQITTLANTVAKIAKKVKA
jgi:hypothetical protein